MAEVGFARFSAREVAKRIGYSIGTLYNVFGSYDGLLLAINGRTFEIWAGELAERLERASGDRITILVEDYFRFASTNRNLWMAIYDHRLPPGVAIPESYTATRAKLTDIVTQEVACVADSARSTATRLAHSLIATVHGHCTFALNGSFALMGEPDPLEMALARVREAIAAAGRPE